MEKLSTEMWLLESKCWLRYFTIYVLYTDFFNIYGIKYDYDQILLILYPLRHAIKAKHFFWHKDKEIVLNELNKIGEMRENKIRVIKYYFLSKK